MNIYFINPHSKLSMENSLVSPVVRQLRKVGLYIILYG